MSAADAGSGSGAARASILTFGELLLRLSPPGHERFLQSPRFTATFGGSEANVAVSLAHFGHRASFVSRIPANPIGDAAVAALRAEGVDVSRIARGGDRLGIYFAETGASQRPSRVVYDRAHSAIAEIADGDVDWEATLDDISWVHTCGITPALSQAARRATAALLERCRERGLPASFDLNYRAKLWTRAAAQATLPSLLRGISVLIANEEDLQTCLGVDVDSDVTSGDLDLDAYAEAARRVAAEHELTHVAITLRESHSASDNGWSALLYERASDGIHRSQSYEIRLVDRIGGGDSFAAGLIHGLLAGKSAPDALVFAVAASALKQTIPGDFNRVSAPEVERLVAGDRSGRVQR
ncbi:MAG TPA: sugar kinase [Thermoanaerobaculia bacterium]|nr:sugar kinase [Thermoanaerobaculia bacterium]